MADSSTYTIRIAGGVDAAVLGSLDALKNRILGTDGVLAGMSARFTGMIAGVLGGGALLRLGMDAIRSADDLGKFSQEVGVGVEQLSKLKYAADLSDVGDHFRQGMLKLSSSIAESVDQSSKASQVFRAMGVATTDLAGKLRPTDQVLFEVADKFASYSDGANKAALAQELFGTKNVRFIAMLSDGSQGLREMGDELKRINGVVTDADVAISQRFNDSMRTLQIALGGAAKSVMIEIIPSLTSLAKSFTEVGATGTSIAPVFTVVTQGIKYLSIGVVEATGLLKVFGIMLGQMPVAAWEAMKGNLSGAAAVWKQMNADLDAAQQERYAKIDEMRNPIPALVHTFRAPPPKAEAPNPFTQSDTVKDYIQDLRDALDLEQRSLELLKARNQVDFTKTDAEKRDAELQILAREAGLLDDHIAKLKARRELLTDPKSQDQFDNAIRSAEQRRSGVNVRMASAQGELDPRSVAQNLQFAMTQLRQQTQAVGTAMANLVANMKGALDGVAGSVGDIIMRTRTMGQVWATAGAQAITAITKMVSEYVAGKLAMMAVDAIFTARSAANNATTTATAIPAGIAQAGAQGGWAGILIYIGVFAAAMAAITALAAAATGGFQDGGYTGNMSSDQVAGVVHGREYVFDADSTSRIGVANLERIRSGNYAPAAASGSSDRAQGGGKSKGSTIQVAFVNDRQSMRDWAARDGEKVIVDNWRKRGWKPPT